MDLASWLRSLGLEQYEAVFRENVIDLSVLPEFDRARTWKSWRYPAPWPSPQITARDSKPRNNYESCIGRGGRSSGHGCVA